jgi:hypothetical protein
LRLHFLSLNGLRMLAVERLKDLGMLAFDRFDRSLVRRSGRFEGGGGGLEDFDSCLLPLKFGGVSLRSKIRITSQWINRQRKPKGES